MALSKMIDDTIQEQLDTYGAENLAKGRSPGAVLQDLITDLLNDAAVRNEVYDEAKFHMTAEDASIADIHAVLDALVRVFQDDNVDPIETVSEVDTAVAVLTE